MDQEIKILKLSISMYTLSALLKITSIKEIEKWSF